MYHCQAKNPSTHSSAIRIKSHKRLCITWSFPTSPTSSVSLSFITLTFLQSLKLTMSPSTTWLSNMLPLSAWNMFFTQPWLPPHSSFPLILWTITLKIKSPRWPRVGNEVLITCFYSTYHHLYLYIYLLVSFISVCLFHTLRGNRNISICSPLYP